MAAAISPESLAERYRDIFIPAEEPVAGSGIATYSPEDLARKHAGRMVSRGEISDQARLRLANIPKGPSPEGITSPPWSQLAEEGLRTAAELPERARKAIVSAPTLGINPLEEAVRRVTGGIVGQAAGLAVLGPTVMASQMENTRNAGILPATAKTVLDLAESFTGAPRIAEDIRQGDLPQKFAEDPVGALMPYLMAGGVAKGAMGAMEAKPVEGPRLPPVEEPAVQSKAPEVGEQVLDRNFPGPVPGIVPVNDLVARLTPNSADALKGAKSEGPTGPSSSEPIVFYVERGGRVGVLDGYHRLADAVRRGEENIPARLATKEELAHANKGLPGLPGPTRALEAAGGRMAAKSYEARVEEAARVLGMTEKEKAEFAGADDLVGEGYATSLGTAPNHPAPLSFAQEMGDRLRALNVETSPALADLEGSPIHTAAIKYMSARDNASGLSALAFDDMKRALPKPEDRVNFARFLNSEQAKALMKDPELAPNVRVPILTPEEEAGISPKAILTWRQKVQPIIERYKEAAGIKGTRETESGLYSKLHAIEPDESLPWDMPVEPARGPGGGGKARPPRTYAFGKARAAMRATGSGEYYSVDLKDIIEHPLQDRIPRAEQNNLLKTVESYRVKPDETGQLPKVVAYEFRNGRTRQVPVVPVDLLKSFPMQFAEREGALSEPGKTRPVYSTKALRTIRVPAPVREAMNAALNPTRDINIRLVTPLARLATSSQLASFAEGLGHSYVVLSNIWNMPGAGRTLGLPGKVIARLGPIGRIPMIVADIVNVSGEGARADFESGFKYGGFRASQLAGQEHAGMTSLYEKVPGIRQMKEAIFGLRGLEMRSRVALYRAARAADPSLGEAAAWSKVNNELGSYVRDLQPPIVRFLRGSGIDPFAAAGVASIKTGIKSLAGRNIQGFAPEVWWNSLVAPAVTMYLLSKAMDEKRRDPWEVPGYKPGYVLLHSDPHKTVWVNASKFLGPAERGLRALGITSVMTRIAKGQATANDLIEAWVQGLLNTPLGRLGPIHRVGFALGGVAPYVTSRWDLLRLTPKSQTRQVQLNVQEALKQASPLGLKAIPSEGELTPDTVPGYVAYLLSRAAALPVSIRGSEKGFASGLQRSGSSRAYDVARDIAYSAENIQDPVERRKYVIRRLMLDVDPKYRQNAKKTVDSMMSRRK